MALRYTTVAAEAPARPKHKTYAHVYPAPLLCSPDITPLPVVPAADTVEPCGAAAADEVTTAALMAPMSSAIRCMDCCTCRMREVVSEQEAWIWSRQRSAASSRPMAS